MKSTRSENVQKLDESSNILLNFFLIKVQHLCTQDLYEEHEPYLECIDCQWVRGQQIQVFPRP